MNPLIQKAAVTYALNRAMRPPRVDMRPWYVKHAPWLIVGGAGAGVGIYYWRKAARVKKWMARLDEDDVAVAAVTAAEVGPPSLKDRLVNAIPGVSWAKDAVDKVKSWFGKGKADVINDAFSKIRNWELCQEAYQGLTGGPIMRDLSRELSEKDLKRVMATMRDAVERGRRGAVSNSESRNQFVRSLYEVMDKAPAEKIVTLNGGNSDKYKNWRMATVKDVKGSAKPGGGAGEMFRAGAYAGNPTKRLWKSKRGEVRVELTTPSGLRWFDAEDLKIYT